MNLVVRLDCLDKAPAAKAPCWCLCQILMQIKVISNTAANMPQKKSHISGCMRDATDGCWAVVIERVYLMAKTHIDAGLLSWQLEQ